MINVIVKAKEIKITWDAVDGASRYDIYRKEQGEDEYKLYGIVTKLVFVDTAIKYGLDYSYKVYGVDAALVTPMEELIGTETVTYTEGLELFDLLPGVYKIKDTETTQLNSKGQLERFLEMLGDKADEFLASVELYQNNIIDVDKCAIEHLKKWEELIDADLGAYEDLYIWRNHLKHQVALLMSRGTERGLVQFIKLFVGWNATVIEYFLGDGYGEEEYGNYTYGSARGADEYSIDVQFVLEDIEDDPYYNEKIVLLNTILPRYLPSGVTFTLAYI